MSLYIVVNMTQSPRVLSADDLGVHADYPEDPGIYTDYEKALTDAVAATQKNCDAVCRVFRLETMEAHVASVVKTHWVCPGCWVLVSKGQTCACGRACGMAQEG